MLNRHYAAQTSRAPNLEESEKMTLSLLQASTVVDAALEEGERRGFLPLCVVVVDAGGHLLALKRDHRASIYRPQIATAKASGCIGMGFGGRELARRAQAMPAF